MLSHTFCSIVHLGAHIHLLLKASYPICLGNVVVIFLSRQDHSCIFIATLALNIVNTQRTMVCIGWVYFYDSLKQPGPPFRIKSKSEYTNTHIT